MDSRRRSSPPLAYLANVRVAALLPFASRHGACHDDRVSSGQSPFQSTDLLALSEGYVEYMPAEEMFALQDCEILLQAVSTKRLALPQANVCKIASRCRLKASGGRRDSQTACLHLCLLASNILIQETQSRTPGQPKGVSTLVSSCFQHFGPGDPVSDAIFSFLLGV